MKRLIYVSVATIVAMTSGGVSAYAAQGEAAAKEGVTPGSVCPVMNIAPKRLASSMGAASDSPGSDELSKLDDSFQKSYSEAKSQIRESLGPVIIVANDVMLLKDGKKESANCIPNEYTITKTMDHVPLDIFVILTNTLDKPLSDKTKAKLREVDAFIDKTRPEVDKSGLPTESISRQHKIMDMSKAYIASTLKAGTTSHEELQTFTRSISKLTLDNADEAEAATLTKFDAVISSWHKNMSADEWNRTKAIVVSGHMPRIENSSMQYLLKLFKQKQEGDRVIYFEGDLDESKAIDLLVTHVLDRRIAIDFYTDPWRMHRDLLADATKKYLKKHPPGK